MKKKNIKARPKISKGNYFRSITEYAWSEFFDACDIRFLYEYKLFHTSEGDYLPDFYLPNLNIWVEIKPSLASDIEARKCSDVSKETGELVILLSGMPQIQQFSDELLPANFGINLWYAPRSIEGVRYSPGDLYSKLLNYSKDPSLKTKTTFAFKSAMDLKHKWESTLAEAVDASLRYMNDGYRYAAQAKTNSAKDLSKTEFEQQLFSELNK